MSDPLVTLSIVTVSYNTVALLRKALTSIYAQPHPYYEFETFVVDNASKDNSIEMVQTEFPQVQLIVNTENRGFAAASNQAMEQARGNFILLLNPDTQVVEDAIWKMVGFLEAEPQAAVVGPALQYADKSFQESVFRFPSLSQVFLDFFPLNWRLTRSRLNGRYARRLFGGKYPTAFEVDFPLGACMLIRRTVIDKVGLMDEDFFMYMEEIDWCYRIKQTELPSSYRPLGLRFRPGRRKPNLWKIYCLPAAHVVHHGGASTKQFKEEMFVQLFRSRNYFYKKHYSRQFQMLAHLITRLGLLGRAFEAYYERWQGQLDEKDIKNRMHAYWRVWQLQ